MKSLELRAIRAAYMLLPDQEKEVLGLRCGLWRTAMNYEQIAYEINADEAHVRKLERLAIKSLAKGLQCEQKEIKPRLAWLCVVQ